MTVTTPSRALDALRAFARKRPVAERCDLCAAPLPDTHAHLLDRETGRLACACVACGRLLGASTSGRWALSGSRARRLVDFRLADEQWQALGVPVGLAFFVHESQGGDVVARYPSPVGIAQSVVEAGAWQTVLAMNPGITALACDVEALLVNRWGDRRDHYIVSLEDCYRVAGVLRRHWRGWSGGPEAAARISELFEALDADAGPA